MPDLKDLHEHRKATSSVLAHWQDMRGTQDPDWGGGGRSGPFGLHEASPPQISLPIGALRSCTGSAHGILRHMTGRYVPAHPLACGDPHSRQHQLPRSGPYPLCCRHSAVCQIIAIDFQRPLLPYRVYKLALLNRSR